VDATTKKEKSISITRDDFNPAGTHSMSSRKQDLIRPNK
jgi:hypothetical protein